MQCKVCGKIQDKPPHYSHKQWEDRIYCSKKCRGKDLKPITFTRWKGGKTFFDGYWWIYKPEHSRAVNNYVKQSTLVLENKLGRLLEKNEIPHHIDGDKSNDHPDNLMVMDSADHSRHHTGEGENSRFSKLTKTQVQKIRLDNRTLIKIAQDYGVYYTTIQKIKQNTTWRSV